MTTLMNYNMIFYFIQLLIILIAFAVDFRDIFKATNAMYIFSSLDLYPDILFPAI